MMRGRHYILVGVIAYVVFLIATLPAAPVLGMLRDHMPVTINNVSGSLWNGRAGSVITGKLSLDNVEWSFLPLHLLLAKAAIDVEAKFNGNPLESRLSTGLGGNLAVDDLNVKLGASDVASLVVLPLGELSGDFFLRINSAIFQPGSVPRIDGTLNWNKAAITVAETADLGNVSILLNEDDDSPLTASISNKGGQLTLSGNLTTDDTGQYSLKLSMKPNASASDNLISSLGMVAKKQRNGEFILNNTGNLKQLGLM
jgi:general secretion pathway protein N